MTRLKREVFKAASPEMYLPPDAVPRVVKPLHGISESGPHCSLTCLHHHTTIPAMERAVADPCVLIQRVQGRITGAISLQVDKRFGIGTDELLNCEKEAANHFKFKDRIMLSKENEVKFNGVSLGITKMEELK